MTPTIVLTPAAPEPAKPYTVTGQGWSDGKTSRDVRIVLDDKQIDRFSTRSGNWTRTYTAPAAGDHKLEANAMTGCASVAFTVGSVITPPPPPTGPTFFVAPNGTGDGSQLRPWGSGQKFVDTNPPPGSTLFYRGGAYPRSAGFLTAGDSYGHLLGTVDKPITIKNAPGETVTFPNVTEPTIIFHGDGATGRIGASYVILEGINFPNILVDDAAAVVVGGDHVTKYLVNHITIRKASMNLGGTRTRNDHCIGLIDGCEDTTIEDMDLAGTPTSGFGIAIYSNTAPLRTVVRRLFGHDFGPMPIQVYDYAFQNAVASISVEDSTFRRNGEHGIDLRWHGPSSVTGCSFDVPQGTPTTSRAIYDPNMPGKTTLLNNTYGA